MNKRAIAIGLVSLSFLCLGGAVVVHQPTIDAEDVRTFFKYFLGGGALVSFVGAFYILLR